MSANDQTAAPQNAPIPVDRVVDYLQQWYQQGYTSMNSNGDNVLNAQDARPTDPAATQQFLRNSNIDIARFTSAIRGPLTQFAERFDVDRNGQLSPEEQQALSARMRTALEQFRDPQGTRTAENMVEAISASLGVQSGLPNQSNSGQRQR